MTMQTEKKKKEKPRYNMFQSAAFMLAAAWNSGNKSVIWLCILTAALTVATSLLGLFVAPTILSAIQAAVPLRELVVLILMFAGAMLAVGTLSRYVETNVPFGRGDIRKRFIVIGILQKACKTGFSNLNKGLAQIR